MKSWNGFECEGLGWVCLAWLLLVVLRRWWLARKKASRWAPIRTVGELRGIEDRRQGRKRVMESIAEMDREVVDEAEPEEPGILALLCAGEEVARPELLDGDWTRY